MTAAQKSVEDQAVELAYPELGGPVVILCEHASNRFPAAFGTLGLDPSNLDGHIAWDPGARAVGIGLARALDAPFVASTVSRLVYDCNRPPEHPGAMPVRSEKTDIPGNRDLSAVQRQARVDQVYTPFHDLVEQVIADRLAAGHPTAIVTIHSFTPVYFDTHRDVEIGILHDDDSALADAMLANAPRLPHRRVARNQPYGPEDGVTHSLKLHGLANGLPNVMIEIRNDLLTSPAREEGMTREILDLLRPALTTIGVSRLGRPHA